MEVLSSAEEQMRWSSNKRLHLEMGLIRGVHSLAEANISDIIRALNGAPLPETPIATTVLPEVVMPTSTVPSPAQTPAPVTPPSPVTEPTPSPEPEATPAAYREAETAPVPEPIPPAPAFQPAPGEPAFSAESWQKILQTAEERHPMCIRALGNTLFLAAEGNLLTVAVHPEDTATRDHLYDTETQEYLNEAARELFESDIRLNVVTDISVPPPPVPEPEVPEPAPAPKPTPSPRAQQAEETTPVSHQPSNEEFYQDPLIEEALRIFHAKIVKQ